MTNPWLRRCPLHFAHQGGGLEAPPNTLFAFARAITCGADALELDVHATADGHLVVLHDDTVDASTDGTGRVADFNLSALRRLDAAYRFAGGTDAAASPWRGVATGRRRPPAGFTASDFRIPLLSEVLARFPDVIVNLDIKATAPQVRPYEATLAALLAEHGRHRADTIVGSFHDPALTAFRALEPPVATSAGPQEVLRFWQAVQTGAGGVALEHPLALQVPLTHNEVTVVTPAFVRAGHDHGLAVHVWTIDDADVMRHLLAMGVDGLVTDRPSVLQRVLSGRAGVPSAN